MKQSLLFSFLVSLVSLLTACSSTDQQACDIIEITPSESSDLNWLAITDTTVVALETTDESLIGGVDCIINDKSQWYILGGKSSVFKFAENGKFISSIGVKGNGPGEFTSLNTMSIHDGKIYLNDANQGKVCVYDTDGNWIEDISDTECLKFAMSMQPIGDGKFLVASSINFMDRPVYGLWDPSNPKELTTIVTTEYTFQGANSWAQNPMTPYKDDFLCLEPLSSTVYRMDVKTGACDPFIVVDGCYPADMAKDGDYNKVRMYATKDYKANDLMRINSAGDFAAITMLRGFAIVHIPSGNWWYGSTKGLPVGKGELPFMNMGVNYSYDDKIVSVYDASTIMRSFAEKPGYDKLFHGEIDPEDNPTLIIYTLRYKGDAK